MANPRCLVKIYDQYDRETFFWLSAPEPVTKQRRKKVEPTTQSRWQAIINFVKKFYKG